SENDRTIKIKKVDPRNLPDSLRDAEGIRVGYIDQDIDYVVPGVGSPNVPESSSVYAFDLTAPASPVLTRRTKTGLRVGEMEEGINTFSGSHPNALAVGPDAIYVSNGNNDSISILQPGSYQEPHRVSLDVFRGSDKHLRGIQPVALALSP